MNENKLHEMKEEIRLKFLEKYKFYSHLIIYILVNTLLIIINLTTNSASYWFIFPVSGWGIALFIHYIKYYSIVSNFSYNNTQQKFIRKNKTKKK